MVSEHAPWWSTASNSPSSPPRIRSMKSSLSRKSAMSRSARFATLSARLRLSTAMMSAMPRSLSAFTTLEPMNPAAPVTMRDMALFLGKARGELFGMDHGGAELAHDDAAGEVGDAHGRV